MLKHRTQQPVPATLYRVVFGNVYIKVSVALLLGFMFLQPVAQVYAAETEVTQSEAVSVSPEPEPEVQTAVAEPEVSEVVTEAEIDTDTEVVETIISEADFTNEEIAEVNAVETQSTNTGGASTTPKKASTTPTTVSGNSSTSTVSSTQATTTEVVSEEKATSSATSTVPTTGGDSTAPSETTTDDSNQEVLDPVPNEVSEPVDIDETDEAVVEVESEEVINQSESEEIGPTFGKNSEQYYEFSESECIAVGDGSYYCNALNSSAAGVSLPQEIVKAEPDGDGDYEIFLFIKDHYEQITHNKHEDKAPFYDPVDQVVVWHRLVNGSYQIFSYDVKAKTETRLDRNSISDNNMQPTYGGGYTVWQAWLDNNWEIVLYDGATEQRLTTSPQPDMAPAIQGDYILWHTTTEAGSKQAMVYNLKTGQTSPISDADGGRVMNPRFVLVYDTKFENGDIITKGFDPNTGSVIPLSAQSGPAPVDIPSPEPTGETQALIQAKTTSGKDDIQEALEGVSGTGTSVASNTATSSTSLTPEETASSTTSVPGPIDVIVGDIATTSEPLPLTEFDLIIEPFSIASSSQSNDRTTATSSVE